MSHPLSFGALLRQYRRARDVTQDELARRAACAVGTIKKIEADERRPSRELAERFAQVLDVPSADQTTFLRIARGISPDAVPRPMPVLDVLEPHMIGVEDLRGRQVRGYAIQERIGAGTFGVVYRAIQSAVQRQVAIKIILPHLADHPDFIRRFEAEARVAADLEHPHIVPLYDFWREPKSAYLVMRYMRGGSIAASLQNGPLASDVVLLVMEQVGAALDAIHRGGIVHRDLKPANILRDAAGHAYLADFGIASTAGNRDIAAAAQSGWVVGSLNYLAPEQLLGDHVTPATDIYSLGLTLYELLTAEKPFQAPTPADLIPLILSSPVPMLHVRHPYIPPALDEVIQRATAKDPTYRYATVRDMVAAVGAVYQRPIAGHYPYALHSAPASQQSGSKRSNPYKGLRAFGEQDARDFFGRDTLVARLVERLSDPVPASRFLAIVGPSGSGKSSVVRAGLVPALRQGGVPGSEQWFVTECIPGAHPLEELELALLRVAVRQPANLADQLQRDARGLLRAARLILPDDDNELVVVIDQFEELFTMVADESVRAHVLDMLVAAITDPRSTVRVVITLRADFYDRPLHHAELGDLLRSRTELVLPLTTDEVEQAIVGPARRAGLQVEPALITDIIYDLGGQPGILPLLQYALTELFEHCDSYTLTRAAYHASGGVRSALARRAEFIYAHLDSDGRAAAKQMFLRLVTLGEGIEDTRRRVVRTELTDERAAHGLMQHAQPVEPDDGVTATLHALLLNPSFAMDDVLDRYGHARLLTFDRDPLTRAATVEIAHEALLRAWERLREWLEESRADVRTQRLLNAAALEWEQHDHDASFLATGSRLTQFIALAEASTLALNADERRFLDASVVERDRLAAAELKRQQRELEQAQVLAQTQRNAAKRLRFLVAGLALFLVGALGLSMFAFTQRSYASASLSLSEAQRLAAQAQALYQANGSSEVVALLAIRSLRQQYTPEGDAALVAAASLAYPRQTLHAHNGWVQDVVFSPDDRYLLSGSSDGTALLWQARNGQLIRTFKGHRGAINGVAFSPDGTLVVTASDDKTVRVWEAQTGKQVQILDSFEKAIWSVSFSPNGRYIATGGLDKTARIWDVQSGAQLHMFEGHQDEVYGVAFSPDGTTVVSSGKDQVVRLWDAQTGVEIRSFEGHAEQVRSVAFSPDGAYLLTGSHDKTARVWNVATGAQLQRLSGHSEFIWKVRFTPDGKFAVTASQDKTVRVWDVATGTELQRYTGHTNYVVTVAVSPDGSTIATGSRDRTTKLWDMQSHTILPTFSGHTNDVHWAVFSPDDRYVFTGSLDGTGRLWDAQSGQLVRVLKGHSKTIHTVAFAPDGRSVYTCSFDNTARRWDVQTGAEIHRFSDHGGAVYGIAVSSNGRFLATSGDSADPTVRLWDARTGKPLRVLHGHTNNVHSLTFSPDNKFILSGSFDETARIWDIHTGALVRTLNIPDSAISVAYSPDGTSIVTGGNDKTARVWDAQTGREIRRFVGHTDIVKAAVFSSDGAYLLTGSADTTARLWDAQTGQEIRRLSGHTAIVNTVAFSADGRYLLSGSGDRTARLWDRDYHQTIRALCGRLLRDLSAEERARHGIDDTDSTCEVSRTPQATAEIAGQGADFR